MPQEIELTDLGFTELPEDQPELRERLRPNLVEDIFEFDTDPEIRFFRDPALNDGSTFAVVAFNYEGHGAMAFYKLEAV